MILLALETATSTCGAAVLDDDTVVAEAHLHRPRVHAERLTPLVEDLLGHAGVATGALDAVAASMGPGSYTGLRIGVSTAKGWALAADAAFVGVPTLEAYAAQLRPVAAPGDVVCALLDARRDEVYAGAYRRTTDGMDQHASTTALPVDDLPGWVGTVDGRLWLVGDGAPKSQAALGGTSASTVLPADTTPPSAGWVARCGRQRLEAHGPDDVATVEPLYVKDVHATPAPSPFD
ncbi:tRNA (adenosine(37)-N6)-threonylcarbamoyltransferase complex dimerization subunit type 1 TsaB [Salinibacter grassmerensis]|uniref:tRNA (adenosine(37)-N6)-threonylcarbamoyltransferase complex dimerization subunit type 1 TsaB n=1 Tax=Salinibacter grassmerensis TaxID=3040353 RepID=UPI0021E7AABB|nr:tRNA (adenosine(37)-N6)-threonylcarbamoyltransferase complex dimerization subunit type 1 TsaB [Salinibacter grassmerensis]